VVELLTEHFSRLQDREARHDVALFLGDQATRAPDALQYFTAAAEARPDSRAALRGLVATYRRVGDDHRAAEATDRLLQLFDPSDPSAIDLRMGLASYLGRSPEGATRALEHLAIVLRVRPDDARALGLCADLLERSHRTIEAAEVIDRLLERERSRPVQHDLWFRKARLLADVASHADAALDAAERAVTASPGNRESVTLLIDLLERRGASERIGTYLQPIRTAVLANIARAAVSLRDIALLVRIASVAHPPLADAGRMLLHALDPTSTGAPPGHMQPATKAGLQRILQTGALRNALLAPGEPPQLHDLLRSMNPALQRLGGDFALFDPADTLPIPASADLSAVVPHVKPWLDLVDEGRAQVGASSSHNAALLFPGREGELRVGANLWMQGDPPAWRGACAVAIARHAFGGGRARALSGLDLDLLVAAGFELAETFHPITADPDPRRLRDVVTQLGKHVPRRGRKEIQDACEALSGTAFAPGESGRATTASDLRLAAVLTGDLAGVLGAACLLDGVAGGGLKQRIGRSRLAQDLLGWVLGDAFIALRRTATS
jgi:tetratricopeptide (TPR) repeat protein